MVGWVMTRFLSGTESIASKKLEFTSNKKYTVRAGRYITRITLRAGPSLRAAIIGFLESGDEFNVLEPGEEWTAVSSKNKKGWVRTQPLKEESPYN
jgi:uncharacterized protein YraI